MIDGHRTSGSCGRLHCTRVVVDARPSPILGLICEPGLHRIRVDVVHLVVVLLHRAQGAIEKSALEKYATCPSFAVDALRGSHFDGLQHARAGWRRVLIPKHSAALRFK